MDWLDAHVSMLADWLRGNMPPATCARC